MVLPDHILKCLSPADRARLGKAGLTAAEAGSKALRRWERDEHNLLVNWLRLQGLWFWHARTDRRTGSTVGTPDFLVVENGRCLPVELKIGRNLLSVEQLKVKEHLEATGTKVSIVASAAEAIECVRAWRAACASHTKGAVCR